ncbi:A2MG protein, partial [Chloropsis hardwickii]|nr:A2MG protein [Chloropsis hardwickii]
GTFRFFFSVEAAIAPVAQMLVYTTSPSGFFFASSQDFQVDFFFPNKVSFFFAPKEGLPAFFFQLQLHTSPRFFFALRAVDKSVFFLKPENELSPIFFMKESQGYSFRDYYLVFFNVNPCVSLDFFLLNGFLYVPIFFYGEGDTYNILFFSTSLSFFSFFFFLNSELGLKVFTSSKIHKPELCEHYPEHMMERSYSGSTVLSIFFFDLRMTTTWFFFSCPEDTVDGFFLETVRKYFPVFFIWDIVSVNSEGKADLEVTVPDTITEWKANAFCTFFFTGFGLSPTVFFLAFQPFFVELFFSYSVVRGESFFFKATVFNYLPFFFRVSVSLAKSTDFLAVPVGRQEESYCICVNERKTAAWAVTPRSLGKRPDGKKIVGFFFSVWHQIFGNQQPCGNYIFFTPEKGRKDTFFLQLLVEPEGTEVETTYNSVLCASG